MEIIDIADNDVPKTKYKCNLCDFQSISRMYINSHKRHYHTNEGEVYRCNQCQQTFTWKTSFENHVKRIHNKNLEFHKCSYCDLKTLNPYYMRKHEQRHLSSDMYQKCDECGKFLKWNSMLMHLKDHEKMKNPDVYKFKCGECDYITNREHLLDKHKLQHSESIKSCKYCYYKTPHERSLHVHVSKNHAELKCLLCDFKTMRKPSFKYHKIFSHPLKCTSCDFQTISPAYMNFHKNQSHQISIQCEECTNVFESTDSWIKHEDNTHNIRVQKCDFCDFITYKKHKQKQIMGYHKISHRSEQPIMNHRKKQPTKNQRKKQPTKNYNKFSCNLCDFQTPI